MSSSASLSYNTQISYKLIIQIKRKRCTFLLIIDRPNMLPLGEKSKRCDGGRGKGVTISHKDVMAHAAVKDKLGHEVHACVSELEAYHCEVGLG